MLLAIYMKALMRYFAITVQSTIEDKNSKSCFAHTL